MFVFGIYSYSAVTQPQRLRSRLAAQKCWLRSFYPMRTMQELGKLLQHVYLEEQDLHDFTVFPNSTVIVMMLLGK